MTAATIPADHPLRRSFWIWPEGYMYLYNHFAHFRYDFELTQVPAKAPLFITADKGYRLYVNGRYVCRGPARGYQSHWPFDEVDLHSYLRPGHNWLAVEAYTPGVSTFQYLHYTKAGMICAADWGDCKIVTTRDWLMRRSPVQKIDTWRLSMQLDFQEDCNLAADDRSWITSLQPPTDWDKNYFPPAGQNINQFPFGQPPYDDVEARGIPLLREELTAPAAVTSQGVGECRGEYRDCRNISWHWIEHEVPTVKQWEGADTVKAERTAEALELIVDPAGKGKFRAITVDLGEISVGTLNVEIDGATGSELVDFQYHQCLRNGIPEFLPLGSGCMVALAGRLRPVAGRSRHEFFHIMGARHVTVIARDVTKKLKVRLTWRTALYPFTMSGKFECSDPILNDIHAICRRTQQICAIDAYVDTPWREQAQWWGDARVQARNTFFLDGDARLFARGIRSIAGQDAPQGLTYGHAPTCSGWCILPDFALTWIMTVWDHYWQTGDLKVFREQHGRIKKVLRYFETPEARNRDGLLVYDRRFWLFEDWATLPKENIPTFLNLWHLYTLEHYVMMLRAAGCEVEYRKISRQAQELRKLLVERFYDAKQGLFVACLDDDGNPVGEPSVHDQVLAIALGLVPEARQKMLKKRLLPYLKQEKLTCAVPSAFWVTYFFDCMRELGFGAEVVEFIRAKWTPMLSTGTTWEGYDWNERVGGSCSHAWTAHPSYHLVNILAGLNQTAPGWREVRMTPVFASGINHAAATVPTPLGPLTASWRRAAKQVEIEVTLPEGMTLLAELPDRKRKLTRAGRHNFSVKL